MDEIKLQSTQSLLPPLYYTLSRVREGDLSYRYYGARHPGAIFTRTFSDVLEMFALLYKQVNNVQASDQPCAEGDRHELIVATQQFIASLLKYFEAGYEIFLCFCPADTKPTPSQQLHRWFAKKSYNNCVATYFTNTNPQLEQYRKALNALKHSSTFLRPFQFINPTSQGSTIGFYLEGPNEEGAIGPIVDFHPLSEDRYTAWSYNFHLRTWYYLIYKIAVEADATIQQLCIANNYLLPTPVPPLTSPGMERLVVDAFTNMRRLASPNFFYFPQEANETTKVASLSTNNEALRFTDYQPTNVIPKGVRTILQFSGDGFSRSFVLPYFKAEEKPGPTG